MKEKPLTNLRLPDLWKEFNSNFNESFWEEFEQKMKLMKKKFIELALQEEITALTGAQKYERTPERVYRRNGYWKRYIILKDGKLQINMPRLREKGFQSKIIPRYIRRQSQIDEILKQIFIYGASTRLTAKALKPLIGEVSAQTISNIAKSLDEDVKKFHRREITEKYMYLFLDAIVLKIKTGIGSKSRAVLAAYGVTVQGIRQIIDFRVVDTESENKWTGFLQNLQTRGLTDDTLSLIVTDGSKALENAVDNVFPLVLRQRCWAHKMRNVAKYLRKKDEKECLFEAKKIYSAENLKEAKRNFQLWESKWGRLYPKAAECIRKNWEQLTAFYKTPKALWKKLRTTNIIERAFREVRRRTRTMSCFNNVESIERIVFAVISHLNEKWRNTPIYEFTQNY
jgi:transposase-like protein